MDKKNLMPTVAQPVNRSTTGLVPAELAELSEEALQLYGELDSASVLPSNYRSMSCFTSSFCSYDGGDDAE
ncbi:DUF5837 family cyanobactin class RiPP [Microcoleus asticus]|uniref:Microcyclamide/patellamide family RiPP n=1 Tax=Microcoleus asticus IPMA8 TaxID=2563858 RepID=A0ABX2D600_9CYAN|nr:DUF5837 family cyanobactin class RiPP [Microcoleus asticus]NQE37973.1 hypothetical protein [Microcoleus asticus IPMA8]